MVLYSSAEGIPFYATIKNGFKGLTSEKAATKLSKYGLNVVKAELPSFGRQFQLKFLSPLALFQVIPQLLGLLDGDFVDVLSRLGLHYGLGLYEILVLVYRSRQIYLSRSEKHRKRCLVKRDGIWQEQDVKYLVPGDIIALKAGSDVPADCVLIRDAATVDDSQQTGEAHPILRQGVLAASRLHFRETMKLLRNAIKASQNKRLQSSPVYEQAALRSGSKLVDIYTIPDDDRDPIHNLSSNLLCCAALNKTIAAVVVSTGKRTVQGHMLHQLSQESSQPPKTNKKGGWWLFEKHKPDNLIAVEVKKILVTLVLATCLYSWILFSGTVSLRFAGVIDSARGDDALPLHVLLLQVARLIMSTIPIDLEAGAVGVASDVCTSLASLNSSIATVQPERIVNAAMIDTCLFDKTGTLTDCAVVVEGFTHFLEPSSKPVEKDEMFCAMNDDYWASFGRATCRQSGVVLSHAPLRLQLAAAGCHSVLCTMNADNKEVFFGDALEVTVLESFTDKRNYDRNVSSSTGSAQSYSRDGSRFAFFLKSNNSDSSREVLVCAPIKVFDFDPTLSRMSVILSVRHYLLSREFSMTTISHSDLWSIFAQNKNTGRSSSPVYQEITTYNLMVSKGSPESILACLEPFADPSDGALFQRMYTEEYSQRAKSGERVVAYASRVLSRSSHSRSKQCGEKIVNAPSPKHIKPKKYAGANASRHLSPRREAETQLCFNGFVYMKNSIKRDAAASVAELRAAGIQVGMVTGDSVLTAINVAKSVGMLEFSSRQIVQSSVYGIRDTLSAVSKWWKTRSLNSINSNECLVPEPPSFYTAASDSLTKDILILQLKEYNRSNPVKSLVWTDLDGGIKYMYRHPSKTPSSIKGEEKIELDASAMQLRLEGGHPLAATGDAVREILRMEKRPSKSKRLEASKRSRCATSSFHSDLINIQVFGRIDPFTKSDIITAYQRSAKAVMMCGDGCNDVKALRRADIGLALTTTSPSSAVASELGRRSSADIGYAAIAAPFCSLAKDSSVTAAVDILRLGRLAFFRVRQQLRVSMIWSLVLGFRSSYMFIRKIRVTGRHYFMENVLETILEKIFSSTQSLPWLNENFVVPRKLSLFGWSSILAATLQAFALIFFSSSVAILFSRYPHHRRSQGSDVEDCKIAGSLVFLFDAAEIFIAPLVALYESLATSVIDAASRAIALHRVLGLGAIVSAAFLTVIFAPLAPSLLRKPTQLTAVASKPLLWKLGVIMVLGAFTSCVVSVTPLLSDFCLRFTFH